jgi:hypothetical protein
MNMGLGHLIPQIPECWQQIKKNVGAVWSYNPFYLGAWKKDSQKLVDNSYYVQWELFFKFEGWKRELLLQFSNKFFVSLCDAKIQNLLAKWGSKSIKQVL